MSARRPAAALWLLLACASCGDDGPTDPMSFEGLARGAFRGEMSGVVDASVTGEVLGANVNELGYWILQLDAGSPDVGTIRMRYIAPTRSQAREDVRPAPGDYAVRADYLSQGADFGTGEIQARIDGDWHLFVVRDGSLTVTRAGAAEVRGTFTLRAARIRPQRDDRVIRFRGAFRVRCPDGC